MASDFYFPFIGGAERQVQLLSKELSERGHDVAIATVWHAGLSEHEQDGQADVVRLKGLTTRVPWFSKDPKRRYHPPFPDPGIVWGLRALIGRLRPEIVHAHGWIAYSCAAATIGKQIPVVVSVRDYGYSCATRTLLHRGQTCSGPAPLKCLTCASARYGRAKAGAAVAGVFAGRELLRRKVSATHSISTYVQKVVRRDLLAHGRESRGVTIPDFVIPSFLENTPAATSTRDFVGRLPDEPFILFVGSLQSHKGLGQLLAAYRKLQEPPPMVLIGTLWPDSPREFPDGVTVLHDVPHEGVMAAWERCLFGVAPSLWPEPFGGVLTEAMSEGKAVIGTNVGGPADIVLHNETGLLVPPGDVDALVDAMQRLIGDPDFRERLGRAARERVKLFGAQKVLPRFEALYRQLTADTLGER
jgi:glycosyltransferase involved in cell wall biosynthesis